jgi:glutamate synthase (NADPH/NADH) small chain
MTERLNNSFQFVQVGRKDPVKKEMAARTEQFVEIYTPFQQEQAS